jgi:hypothetical protein
MGIRLAIGAFHDNYPNKCTSTRIKFYIGFLLMLSNINII